MLVVIGTPAMVKETVTSLERRMSSGTATPGTMSGAGVIPLHRSSPSSAERTDANNPLTRLPIHQGRPLARPETSTDTRAELSGGRSIDDGIRDTAPDIDTSVNVTGSTP